MKRYVRISEHEPCAINVEFIEEGAGSLVKMESILDMPYVKTILIVYSDVTSAASDIQKWLEYGESR